MENTVRIELLANAGLLLEFQGKKILIDGIFQADELPFSSPSPVLWSDMLNGVAPYSHIDFLLFTHEHPDHFSPEMTLSYIKRQNIQGIFLPESMAAVTQGPLRTFIDKKNITCLCLSSNAVKQTYDIGNGITIWPIQTRHIDQQYCDLPHFCYLIDFAGKRVLFTADVDYTLETFVDLRGIALNAIFVNPLFFDALRRKKFFHGQLQTDLVCIYHIPFSEDDCSHMRPHLAKSICQWDISKRKLAVLCEHKQVIEL